MVPFKIHVTRVTLKLFHKIFPYIAMRVERITKPNILYNYSNVFCIFHLCEQRTLLRRYISIVRFYCGAGLYRNTLWELRISLIHIMYTNLNWKRTWAIYVLLFFIVFLFYPTPSIDTNILFDFIIYSNCYQSIYRMAAFTSMVS